MANPVVVLVPGITGSELSTPPSFFGTGPTIRVWLNYGVIAAGGWRWMKLKPDGTTPDFPLTGVLTPGRPLPHYYDLITNRLLEMGYRVFSPMLDWRGTLANDASRLAETIRLASDGTPVHIIAHSRGGLVTRVALQMMKDAGLLRLVGNCVGLGVPHFGSWEAVGLLAAWQHTEALIRNLLTLIPGSEAADWLIGDLRECIATWPSCYELLPSPDAPGLTDAESQAVWSSSGWTAAGLPIADAWMSAAFAGWRSLPPVPDSVRWLNVAGVGVLTRWELIGTTPPRSGSDFVFTENGDGVVPEAWAVQAGKATLTCPTTHHALVHDARVLAAADTFLQGGLEGGGAIVGPIDL